MFLCQQIKKENKTPYEFGINRNTLLTFNGGVYVPNQGSTKQFIRDEFHRSPYVAHTIYEKLFSTVNKGIFWPGMMKDISEYLAECLECQ